MKLKATIILLVLSLLVPVMYIKAASISNNMKGRILLQVESKGEAWYVNPKDGKRYYMANGNEAFQIMKKLGVGISNKDLDKIKIDASFRKKFIGKILLQVESRGEAYYISFDGRYNYLKDGPSAYQVMRRLGLGVSNKDLGKLAIARTIEKADNSGLSESISNKTELLNFAKNISKECIPMDIIMDGNINMNGAQTLVKFSVIGIVENKCLIRELVLSGSDKYKTANCLLDLPSAEELSKMKESDYSLYADMLPSFVGFDALGAIQDGKTRQCAGDLSDEALAEAAKVK